MSGSVLVLLGGEAPDEPFSWLQVRRGDGAETGRGAFGPGGSAPRGSSEAVLVLRGAEAQVRSLDLPAKTEAQARGAAAFGFEGELAIEPGQTFCAVGAASGTGGRRLAAALDRDRLKRWMVRCREAGVDPQAIYLDCTLLPVAEGHVRLCERDGCTILAGGIAGGLSIETLLAPALAKAWLQRLDGVRPDIVVEGDRLDAVAASLAQAGFAVSRVPGGEVASELARAAIDPPPYAPDLRQGEFAEAHSSGARGRLWATTLVLALAAVLLQVGVLVFNGWRDQKTASEITAKVERDFRQLRPDVKRIVNLRAQVSAAVNAARRPASNPAIATSYPVVDVLQAHPDARLDEVRHEAPGRRVSLRFSGAQSAVLDAVVADLRKTSGNLEVDQMRTDQGRVSVLVTLVAP